MIKAVLSISTMAFIAPRLLLAISMHISAPQSARDPWTSTFTVDRTQLVADGASRYFILDPGHQLVLEHGDQRLVITVTNDTRVVDGVTTRIVEERESKGQTLIEVSRNFFARDPTSGDAYYFGEEVDIYRNGKVVSHDGAWSAGTGGAKLGLFMPGAPVAGGRFYQEVAPRVAMDRVRVVGVNEKLQTPAGLFENCVRLEESTPLEPGVKDVKVFAPGVGLVQDGSLKLVRHGRL
jgi:hypothetical protein